MPSKSKAQQRLMGAAAHGADFPMAREVRSSMSVGDLLEFSKGSMKGKPEHVRQSKSTAGHPHRNLGKYLHPKKRGR